MPYIVAAMNYLMILLQNWYIRDAKDELRVGNLLVCTVLCLFLVWDEYSLDNFAHSPSTSLFYIISMCFFGTEVSFGICIYLITDFISIIDVDLLAVSVFWTTAKIFRNFKLKTNEKYMEIDVRFSC